MLNVAGDLTASVVMERLSPDTRTYRDEMEEDLALEKERITSGDDVIVKLRSEYQGTHLRYRKDCAKRLASCAKNW